MPPARALVWFLGAGAIILSVDALMAYALGPPPGQHVEGFAEVTSVIPASTILPRPLMAGLWAAVLDGFGVAGLLGIRRDPGDYRAWIMATVAFTASIAFQVFHAPPLAGRAVAPLAWAGAAMVLEVPRRPRAGGRGKGRGALGGTTQGTADRAAALSGAPGGALGGGQGAVGQEEAPRRLPPPSPAQAQVARQLYLDQGLSRRKVREGMKAAGHPIGDDKLRQYLDALDAELAAHQPEPAAVAGNGGGVG